MQNFAKISQYACFDLNYDHNKSIKFISERRQPSVKDREAIYYILIRVMRRTHVLLYVYN